MRRSHESRDMVHPLGNAPFFDRGPGAETKANDKQPMKKSSLKVRQKIHITHQQTCKLDTLYFYEPVASSGELLTDAVSSFAATSKISRSLYLALYTLLYGMVALYCTQDCRRNLMKISRCLSCLNNAFLRCHFVLLRVLFHNFQTPTHNQMQHYH